MLTLIKASSEDESFLYDVYRETRYEEVRAFGWSETEQEQFLRMQFEMQRRSYVSQYPMALHQLVMYQDIRIGRLITAVLEQELLLIDISLLSSYRNKGVGTILIQNLQYEAKKLGKTIRLHVIQNNPAQRLYERFGFRVIEEGFPYIRMQWESSIHSEMT